MRAPGVTSQMASQPARAARTSWRLPSVAARGSNMFLQRNMWTDRPQLVNEISLIGEYTGAAPANGARYMAPARQKRAKRVTNSGAYTSISGGQP